MVINRDIARALATRVREHNENPDRLAERLYDALAERDTLLARIEALEFELAKHVDPDIFALPGLTANERPVISIKEAAAVAGVSESTAWRYVEAGHWHGYSVRMDRKTRWHVYADQPLAKKTRKKKKKEN